MKATKRIGWLSSSTKRKKNRKSHEKDGEKKEKEEREWENEWMNGVLGIILHCKAILGQGQLGLRNRKSKMQGGKERIGEWMNEGRNEWMVF